nr:hypothetical protein [Tanacetum cinerariifolium]
SSKDLESLIESQRPEKIKDGLRYNVVPPPAVDLYLYPKKDLSWTGLPEFADNTVTDYSRPAPTVEMINRRNRVKDAQASACWIWKPVKPNSSSIILKRYDYVDVRGRSRFEDILGVTTSLDEAIGVEADVSTKDAIDQEVKKDESSLRYIVLPNWAHDALLESTSSKLYEESSTQVPEGSGNPNPTASSFNPPADQMETLTVKSPIL